MLGASQPRFLMVLFVWLTFALMVSVLPALPIFRHPTHTLSLPIATGKILVFYVIPVMVFFLSAAMVPDWKGATRMGWLDGFFMGKLAFFPLVFWAVFASWYREVWLAPSAPTPHWAVLGHLAGAGVAVLCTVIGLLIVRPEPFGLLFMTVPFVTAVWFTLRGLRLLQTDPPPWFQMVALGLASFPLLMFSLWWSKTAYDSLPDTAPDCFVVTAATRGHPRLVGPLFLAERRGVPRLVNQQLLRFWAWEARWQARFPTSHRACRQIYNRLGPPIARRIRSRWAADVVWLVLKPLEWGIGLLFGDRAAE